MPDAPENLKKPHLAHSMAALVASQEMRRRLVICLDGTWNARDSGTNIYHLANLVQEGIVGEKDDEWFQIVYYDPGVGTGAFDGVTGGAFGIGLSENIREAYDWLVEKFREGDEVYIFGFSRGAFTARSLAGLISRCGLLYRGAPMPPSELWSAYRLLGRYPNPKTKGQPSQYWWERLFRPKRPPFRRLAELKPDPWPDGEKGPAPDAPAPNESERLLIKWSRRIQINCLGVFDTVASLGVDALAIPWLTERTAQFHDTQISSIIQHGYQALAIDEHRANFAHIPWRRSLHPVGPQAKVIEQRWFAGVHSNIGGSYEDDLLAQFPLAWMIKKCVGVGLKFRDPAAAHAPDPIIVPEIADCLPLLHGVKNAHPTLAGQCPHVRDSFSELGHGIWKGLIRSKRDYRTIQPNEEFENSVLMQSANEEVHESVWQLFDLDNIQSEPPRYNPPNLWRIARKRVPNLAPPRHRYLEDKSDVGWFLGWMICVGLVGAAIAFCTHENYLPWIAGVIGAAVAVDFSESLLNFRATLEPDGFRAERRKAVTSFCLFLRLLLLSAVGLTSIFWLVISWPWLFRHDPDWHIAWLIMFNAMVLYCTATAAWCAAPMWDAGYGQMFPLQFAWTPARVLACLKAWTDSAKPAPDEQPLIQPIVHALWRDMLGYIPAYTSVIFVGVWFALSVWGQQFMGLGTPQPTTALFTLDHRSWGLAAVIAIAHALADYTEDLIHLSHLHRYPRPPLGFVVAIGALGTTLKISFALVGGLGVLIALGWLILDQARRIHLFFGAPSDPGAAGGLCALVVLFTILLSVPPLADVIAFLKKRFVRAK